MKINYGLWWHEGRKRMSRNFSINYEMNWDSQDDHEKFRQMILQNHPGTHIVGYAISDVDEEEE